MKKILLLVLWLHATIVVAQNIYTPYKEYIYEAKTLIAGKEEVQYISMWATDDVWEMDSTQRQLFYAYHKHCNKDRLTTAWPYSDNVESTGIIETENRIWLHPPRWEKLSVLEYFPFPEIDKNTLCGDKYKRMFLGYDDFIEKWMWLRYKMTIECNDNAIFIRGRAKNKQGEWLEMLIYEKEKGFVYMEFISPVDRTIKLKLVNIIEHKNS